MSITPTSPHPTEAVYFFLSYAHVPPALTSRQTETDPVVTTFFQDLADAVRGFASPEMALGDGLYDQSDAIGGDWKASIPSALGSAEVLVPLFSPRYIRGAWTRSEHELFSNRFHGAAGAHIQPVSWVPLLPVDPRPAELGDLDADIPEYAAGGLRVMCEVASQKRVATPSTTPTRLRERYAHSYRTILDRLARRIVDVAERTPVGPAPTMPSIDAGASSPTAAQMVIAVLAPTSTNLPEGSRPDSYGPRSTLWRPFTGSGLPVAQQAANIAERLDVTTTILDASTGHDEMRSKPTILLIDPWITLVSDGTAAVRTALADLPTWVTPVVVTETGDAVNAVRAEELAETVRDMIAHTRPRPDVGNARGADEFISTMPVTVTQARRRFLNSIPPQYPKRNSLANPRPPHKSRPGDDR